jgi:hypothetical protein
MKSFSFMKQSNRTVEFEWYDITQLHMYETATCYDSDCKILNKSIVAQI